MNIVIILISLCSYFILCTHLALASGLVYIYLFLFYKDKSKYKKIIGIDYI